MVRILFLLSHLIVAVAIAVGFWMSPRETGSVLRNVTSDPVTRWWCLVAWTVWLTIAAVNGPPVAGMEDPLGIAPVGKSISNTGERVLNFIRASRPWTNEELLPEAERRAMKPKAEVVESSSMGWLAVPLLAWTLVIFMLPASYNQNIRDARDRLRELFKTEG